MLTDNEKLTLTVAIGSAAISLVAAFIAMAQLRASVRQSRHQATFEHLGRVRKLLRAVSHIDPVTARKDALAYYTHQVEELTDSARRYLDLLDEWDLLGVAYRHKQVDRRIVVDSIRNTLRNAHTVDRKFINELAEVLANPSVYADLDHLIACCARPTWLERLTARSTVAPTNPGSIPQA